MNPIVYAIPVFMVTILVEALVAWRKGRALYHVPDALTSLHLGVLSQVTGAFVKTLAFGLYVLIYDQYRAFDLSPKNPALWIGALIVYDLAYYWQHRLGHEVSVLWAAHVSHHSSEYFNLSTALRQSSTTAPHSFMFYLPMALVGVPPVVFLVSALIDLLYQYWVHTELIGRLGIFDRIFVTPSNHRVHHGQNDYCIDCNYVGIFILWDRLFGTFVDERADEQLVYGIRHPLRSFNPLWSNFHLYAFLWHQSKAQKGLRAKLAVWFAQPSGAKVPGEVSAQPRFDPSQFVRYDTGTRQSVQRYAMVQYAIIALLVTHFIAINSALPIGPRLLYGLGILASTIIVGGLLEERAPFRRIEQGRLVLFGLLFALSPSWFGFAAPLGLKAAVLSAALFCALWLTRVAEPAGSREALA
jgi:sterol desaturase/sphingolipid hydroxylase (fatty acid hydroxylase superfamily)